jgi:hypothetical protein
MTYSRLLSWVSLSAIAASACGSANDDLVAQTEQALDTCAAGTRADRSLALTDTDTLAHFSFSRVMGQILNTARVRPEQTTTELFQTWMSSFNARGPAGCQQAGKDPNDYGFLCPRKPEGLLAGADPFAADAQVTFTPVAVFNRFDLAPQDGKNCGEYRIVFALNAPAGGGRGFIIFEATLPNPTPNDGVGACLPVAKFWQGLSANPSSADRAQKVADFFFAGLPGFRPVVHASNYGLAQGDGAHRSGQIRTNFFVQSTQWQLREFKTRRSCVDTVCNLTIEHVAAKANPANELFSGTHPLAPAFRTAFAAQVPSLLAPTMNGIGMATASRFNEWESVSQPFGPADVQYDRLADEAMRTSVQTALTQAGSSLSVDQTLRRATSQTCAGCHQISVGQDLGGGVSLAASLGFVHVDENRRLSPALVSQFLPARLAVLEAFINDRCAGQRGSAPVPGMTLGGSLEGAPN